MDLQIGFNWRQSETSFTLWIFFHYAYLWSLSYKEDKKKRSYLISLRNPLAKYLIFSLFFLSHSFFQHFRTSSHINYKIAKGKIFLICHSIKFANKSIELEKRDTKIFDLKDLTASNNLKIRRKEKRNPIRIPIPYGILEPKDTVRITWITNGPKLR